MSLSDSPTTLHKKKDCCCRLELWRENCFFALHLVWHVVVFLKQKREHLHNMIKVELIISRKIGDMAFKTRLH